MSFIDLLADVVYTDGDILNRTEAMVRNEFSAEAETILNRKVTGAALGTYTMTDADRAEIARFAAVTQIASEAGQAARADMVLLRGALAYESAQLRLALPAYDGPEQIEADGAMAINPAYVADRDERAAAQSIIDSAAQNVLDLVAARCTHRCPVEDGAPVEVIE